MNILHLQKHNWHIILLTALAPIIWGSTYIVTTEILPDNQPLITAVLRTLPLGLVITLAYKHAFTNLTNQLGKHTWLKMWVLALLNISLFQAMLFIGAYRLPGSIVAMVGSIQPLVIMWLMYYFEHKMPKLPTLIAVGFAMLGMSMLLIKPNTTFAWDSIGLIASVIGSISMALGMYLTKRWKSAASSKVDMNMVAFTGWQLLLGGILLLPFALYFEDLPSMDINNIVGYSYLAIFGSAIAYSLWMKGVVQLPTVTVSILGALSPITATLLGWAFLQQALSLLQTFGFVVAIASIVFIQLQTT